MKFAIVTVLLLSFVLFSCPTTEVDTTSVVTVKFKDELNGSAWQKILQDIANKGRKVNLDLSESTFLAGNKSGGLIEYTIGPNDYVAFDPVSSIKTGKDKIISIILPDEATMIIPAVADGVPINEALHSSRAAFRHFTKLEKVESKNVEIIGNLAFIGCSNLIEVDFRSATRIDNRAFKDCISLRVAKFLANPDPSGDHPLKPWLDVNDGFYSSGAWASGYPIPVASPFTFESVAFYDFAFSGCKVFRTLDVRNAWNVYFAKNALEKIGTNLDIYLFDADGADFYGHPQLDDYLGKDNTVSLRRVRVYLPAVTSPSRVEGENVSRPGYPGLVNDIRARYRHDVDEGSTTVSKPLINVTVHRLK